VEKVVQMQAWLGAKKEYTEARGSVKKNHALKKTPFVKAERWGKAGI
jgi:hypothetical protein